MTVYDEMMSKPGALLNMWEDMLQSLIEQQTEYGAKESTPENMEFYLRIELEILNVKKTIKKLKQ